jgi:hypothetical protein
MFAAADSHVRERLLISYRRKKALFGYPKPGPHAAISCCLWVVLLLRCRRGWRGWFVSTLSLTALLHPFTLLRLHLLVFCLLIRRQYSLNLRVFLLSQSHSLSPRVCGARRCIGSQRLHLRLLVDQDRLHLCGLISAKAKPLLHHLRTAIWIPSMPLGRRWPRLLLSMWRWAILLRDRRTYRQSSSAQQYRCRTKHPYSHDALHRGSISSEPRSRPARPSVGKDVNLRKMFRWNA